MRLVKPKRTTRNWTVNGNLKMRIFGLRKVHRFSVLVLLPGHFGLKLPVQNVRHLMGVVSSVDEGREAPPGEHPRLEMSLRKLLFYHIFDHVVVNNLLLALLPVHKAICVGFVNEPGTT